MRVVFVFLLIALCAFVAGKHITRGDDSSRVGCPVCSSVLRSSSLSSPASTLACGNGAAFDLAALHACQRATDNALPSQRAACMHAFLGQCPLVRDQTSDAQPTEFTCAMLGASGEKCEAASSTAEYSIEFAKRHPRVVKPSMNSSVSVQLNIPVRFMWGWKGNVNGYCGETSIQMAGLYYGNYFSQEQVRYAADNAEVIIDVNAHGAVGSLLMTYERWDINKQKQPQAQNFLKWAKGHLDDGAPVIFGGFLQQKGGDSDFDHVMPFLGYEADSKGKITAMIYDDLWSTTVRTMANPADVKTRKSCTQSTTPKQPFGYCIPSDYDSGIAITGIVDIKGETYRTQIDVDRWDEPDWGAEDKLHEKPVLLTPTATISGLDAGVSYSLLRFDEVSALPSSNFLAGSWATKVDFVAEGPTHTLSELDQIMSDGTYFYRTVRSN